MENRRDRFCPGRGVRLCAALVLVSVSAHLDSKRNNPRLLAGGLDLFSASGGRAQRVHRNKFGMEAIWNRALGLSSRALGSEKAHGRPLLRGRDRELLYGRSNRQ